MPFHHLPARFKLDKPLEPEYFGRDLDNPWSPCVSRDGKTTLLIVDSKKHIKKEAAWRPNLLARRNENPPALPAIGPRHAGGRAYYQQ